MTIAEILEQVKALTANEREILMEQLQSMQMQREAQGETPAMPEEHWGRMLNQLMDEIGPIELIYPEIDDPVEWVNRARAERRLTYEQ